MCPPAGKWGRMIDVDALIREADELEPLPASAAKLANLLNREDWVLEEIGSVVSLDQALTGRLLGLANSATSGSRHSISTVDEAVMRMGPGMVLSVALASVVRVEMQQSLPGYGLGEGSLWRHSVASALAVDQARRFCRAVPPSQSFAAALLHDVGMLVLERHLRRVSSPENESSQSEAGTTVAEKEWSLLGIRHDQLGGRIARTWKLPPAIEDGIAFHHDPERASDDEGRLLAGFVDLADIVAHRIGESCAEEPRLSRESIQRIGITQQGFDELCEATDEQLERALEIYS